MSVKHYYKKASQEKKDSPGKGLPAVDRFSDIHEVDRRRHEVLDYLLLGHDSVEISEYLDQPKSVIEKDIEEIMRVGYQAKDEDLTEVRDEMMRIYRLAARESHHEFQRSKNYELTETEEESVDDEGIMTSKRKTVKKFTPGDARHIRNMIDAAKEMGKVTGAQKHKEIEVQQNVQNNEVHILSPNSTQMPQEFDKWNKPIEGVHDADIVGENDDDE